MAPRRESRERALGLCYEREARAISADQLLDDLPAAPDAYAEQLLRGVEAYEPELDGLLREYSEHWAVELNITETEPGVQGDRVSGARKPATMETGLVVQVPLFIEVGETLKVDTRTGEYLARA